MKKATRLLAAVLALLFVLSIAAACGPNQGSPGAGAPAAVTGSDVPNMNATGYPIAQSPVTVSALMGLDSQDGYWEDLQLWNWLAELTNVNFKIEYLIDQTGDQYRDRVGLLFASNNYPEVLLRASGGIRWQEEEFYAREGFFIDTRPLQQYMPNIQEFYQEFPHIKAGQTASDGGMYGFPFTYQGGVGGNPINCYMEAYWADRIGYTDDMPYTVDEYRDFLYAIKAVIDSGDYFRPDPNMIAIGWREPFGQGPHINLTMYGYTGTITYADGPWALPDNKNVQFMVEHPGYRKTLELWRDLYRDGVLDVEVFTMEASTANARKNNCEYAVFNGSSSSLIPELIRSNPAINLDYANADHSKGFGCRSFRPLTSEYSNKARLPFENIGTVNQLMITDKCKNPEIVARWADIFFNLNYDITDNSVPNPMMFYKGWYGEHWEYVNLDRTAWSFLPTPDGQTTSSGDLIDWMYSRNYILMGWSLPCGVYIDGSMQVGGAPMFVAKQYTNIDYQYPYVSAETEFPRLARRTPEETESIATKEAELNEYLRQQWALFMSGQKDLNDANWDDFKANCYKLGVDDILEVRQSVAERWAKAMGN